VIIVHYQFKSESNVIFVIIVHYQFKSESNAIIEIVEFCVFMFIKRLSLKN